MRQKEIAKEHTRGSNLFSRTAEVTAGPLRNQEATVTYREERYRRKGCNPVSVLDSFQI